jgi:hypothetical protein
LVEIAMTVAVSILSPVSTQILILAFRSRSSVRRVSSCSFVLDARQPGQLEVALERVRDDSRHRLVATLDMHARNMVARLKVLVFDLREPSSRDNGTRM